LAAVSQRFVIANVAFNVELQWRKLKQLLGRTQIAKVFLSAIFNTKARKIPGNNLTISLWTGRQTGENKKKKGKAKAKAPQVNLQTEANMIFVSWPLLVFIFQLPLIDIKDSNSGGGDTEKTDGQKGT